MQNRSVVKIGQVGHIFGFLVFWRIDLLKEIFLQIAGLLGADDVFQICGGVVANWGVGENGFCD